MSEAGAMKAVLKYIPKLEDNWPIICLILNIIWPGLGTFIAAFLTKKDKKKTYCIIFGLLQMFTSWILIGWIWSVLWGILIFKRSTGPGKLVPEV